MKRKELRKEFRNHRRSVSQLMEEMGEVLNGFNWDFDDKNLHFRVT